MKLVDYIPWDKSWIIRMGILDLVNGKTEVLSFLDAQENLGGDLIALREALQSWNADEPIDVGESGTLYRFLKFASWSLSLEKKFILQGTLQDRAIANDPSIVHLAQEDLLKIDNGTSQWASAAVLLGDSRRMEHPPFKLALTYDAVRHWQKQRAGGLAWEARRDQTILRQAEAFTRLLRGESSDFIPQQAEDFCFAYCLFDLSAEEGERRWPSLRGHESDRITEIEREFLAARNRREVTSRDHRVVQAVAMWGRLHNKRISFASPQAVAKSWPQFWYFLASCL